jgi:hypothetical protein
MTTESTTKQHPLFDEVARVGGELLALLDLADLKNPPELIKGSVLWAAMTYLGGLVVGMQDGTYAGQDILPETYVPVARLPAGWDTVLEIQKLTSGGSRSDAYVAGASFAHEQIVKAFPPRGPDTGEEPLCHQIARVSFHLHQLLDQIRRPGDDAPGSGNLVLMQFTAEALARTMGQGLFIHYGIVPVVTNPGYLPPEDWKARILAIRDMTPDPYYDGKDMASYDYNDAARWATCKVRDLCRDVTEAPRYLYVRN